MVATRGEAIKPVLVGKSIHNQCIERHNRALNEHVLSTFRGELYQLESEVVLYINDTNIFCLHCVYIPCVNKAFSEFVAAHNNHRISTENNRTPEQLFWCNIMSAYYDEGVLPEHANQPNVEELAAGDLPHACVLDTPNPLQDDELQQLENLVCHCCMWKER